MVGAVFLPIAAVELLRSAIVVDVAYQFMPYRMKGACQAFAIAVTAAVYAVLVWVTWGDALKSFRTGEVMMGGAKFISVWPSRFMLPLGFALATLVCLSHLWRFARSSAFRDEVINPAPIEEGH